MPSAWQNMSASCIESTRAGLPRGVPGTVFWFRGSFFALPGRVSARSLLGKRKNRASGRPSPGRRHNVLCCSDRDLAETRPGSTIDRKCLNIDRPTLTKSHQNDRERSARPLSISFCQGRTAHVESIFSRPTPPPPGRSETGHSNFLAGHTVKLSPTKIKVVLLADYNFGGCK